MTIDAGAPVGRLQWSKLGVTIYDKDGGFITRIEHKDDCNFLNICIQESLRQISVQMQKRAKFKSAETSNAVEIEEANAGGVLGRAGSGDAGQSARVERGDTGHLEVAGTQIPAQEAEAEEPILAAPV